MTNSHDSFNNLPRVSIQPPYPFHMFHSWHVYFEWFWYLDKIYADTWSLQRSRAKGLLEGYFANIDHGKVILTELKVNVKEHEKRRKFAMWGNQILALGKQPVDTVHVVWGNA